MFAGAGGSGVKDIPSSHSKVMPKKCVTCHMYKPDKKAGMDKKIINGGHTFRSDARICLQCHEKPESLVKSWQEQISPLVVQLKALLDSKPNKITKAYREAKMSYDIVMADGGTGLHNPVYAKALLKYSIALLKSESIWK